MKRFIEPADQEDWTALVHKVCLERNGIHDALMSDNDSSPITYDTEETSHILVVGHGMSTGVIRYKGCSYEASSSLGLRCPFAVSFPASTIGCMYRPWGIVRLVGQEWKEGAICLCDSKAEARQRMKDKAYHDDYVLCNEKIL